MVLYERDALLAFSLEVPVALSKVLCLLRWVACGWSFRKTARAMSGARTECLHLPNHLYPLCILGLLFIVSPPASSPAALADDGVARDREKARGECLWSPGLHGRASRGEGEI